VFFYRHREHCAGLGMRFCFFPLKSFVSSFLAVHEDFFLGGSGTTVAFLNFPLVTVHTPTVLLVSSWLVSSNFFPRPPSLSNRRFFDPFAIVADADITARKLLWPPPHLLPLLLVTPSSSYLVPSSCPISLSQISFLLYLPTNACVWFVGLNRSSPMHSSDVSLIY